MMKTNHWQGHVRELLKTSFDVTTTIYGIRWAHDAKSAKSASGYKRFGTSLAERASCLWSTLPAK